MVNHNLNWQTVPLFMNHDYVWRHYQKKDYVGKGFLCLVILGY